MLCRAETPAAGFDLDGPVIAADKKAVVVLCEPVGAYEKYAVSPSPNEERDDGVFENCPIRRSHRRGQADQQTQATPNHTACFAPWFTPEFRDDSWRSIFGHGSQMPRRASVEENGQVFMISPDRRLHRQK